jgi:DNA-binding transcriptional LysR family regulator
MKITFPTWLMLQCLERFGAVRVRFIAVAHPDHPLHRLGRPLTYDDLRAHRQLVVRESGTKRATRPSVEATQRWTLSHMATSIGATSMGYGFAWLPEEKIRAELYLIFADRDAAGPGTLRLVAIIREAVAKECSRHAAAAEAAS